MLGRVTFSEGGRAQSSQGLPMILDYRVRLQHTQG